MQKFKNKIAIILAFIVALFALLSISYASRELNHECLGVDCETCFQLSVLNDLFNGLYEDISVIVTSILLVVALFVCYLFDCLFNRLFSLVSLKIKFSC